MPRKKIKKQTTTRKTEKTEKTEESKARGHHLLRGMRDILPSEMKYWDFIRQKVDKFASSYNYEKIETPVLEEKSLFVRSIGETTDIVEKEMFAFSTSGGESVVLRPEGTAAVARAYIEHGMVNLPQPVKLYYFGPFFRHSRPQAGRLRQFWQFGFEVLGGEHAVVDAQVITLLFYLYKELGLEVSFQVNSLGCKECRENYKKILKDYYRTKEKLLCANCRRRLTKNPLRLLDCKNESCQELASSSPQLVDHLCEVCREHFVKVLEYLDESEIPYHLNARIVRGLDYYSRTTFEIWPEDALASSQTALGGGGRYDDLIESLGDRPTPAFGAACGIERTINLLKERNIPIPERKRPQVFIAQLGEEARKKSLKLFESLRKNNILAAEFLAKDSLKNQLSQAAKLKAKFTLILGQKEILDKTVILRDMESGSQEVIDFKSIIPELQKRSKKNGD